jgi:hypothetical protein
MKKYICIYEGKKMILKDYWIALHPQIFSADFGHEMAIV